MNIRYLLLLLVVLVSTSFKKYAISEPENLAVIIIKLKYNSYGMTGFGGSLKVRNLATDEIFESKSKMGDNPFVIVENLPLGNYEVEELKIISGSNIITLRSELGFNTIKLDSSKVYNLGYYMTKKIPPLMEYHIQVTKRKNDAVEKIYKALKKKSDKWLALPIDFGQNLFLNDSTNIQIRTN
ncbi:MAG: hypothetical protein FGM41_10965 [Bacteroidetes bacterium]|nr:hypothetical protein [Bacteroidota bacterium]